MEQTNMSNSRPNGNFKPEFGSHKFGNKFWHGAKPTPESIAMRLRNRTSVSVFGPRRLGKSSLLAETRERLRKEGKNVIWVDMDTNDSLIKALSEILTSMKGNENSGIVANIKSWTEKTDIFPTEFKSVVGAVISGAVDSTSESYGEKYAEALFRETGRQLKEQQENEKPIIIFDELTILLKNAIDRTDESEKRKVVARLNSFLGLLRHWRKDDVGITMAISGSVSMDWLRREFGIRRDSINDCIPIWIEEMEREETGELIDACVSAYAPKNWTDECSEELLNILPAYFPGVVQLAYDVVWTEDASLEKLKGPLRGKIYKALWNEYFEQFERQFESYSESDRTRSEKLFSEIENSSGGIIDNETAIELLTNTSSDESRHEGRMLLHQLISDSYVDNVRNGIHFSSGLVSSWRKMNSVQ